MSTEASASQEPRESGTSRTNGDPLVIDGISYLPSSVLLTEIPKLSFKDNRAFGVVDPRGESPRIYSTSSQLGFYYNDTRYLSTWETTFNGLAPISLKSELEHSGNTVVVSMTNRDLPSLSVPSKRIPRDTFLIRRMLTLVEDTLYETLSIQNFDSVDHELQVEQWVGSTFDDVFEVRGFPREKRGRMLSPEEKDDSSGGERRILSLQYEGLDGRIRRSFIHRFFDTEKIRLSPSLVGSFTRILAPAKQTVHLKTIVSFDRPTEGLFRGKPFAALTPSEDLDLQLDYGRDSPFSSLHIETDNALLNRSIETAKTDIQMLLTAETGDLLYPYAGIPWYSAPFGRDGIITAYQLLPWHPKLARGVLDYAFQMLGSRVDDFTDEQPGKVFHEMRRGEMALTREVPFIPYYGSVDSTPLALILLHEYVSWTMDLEKLKEWWPSALRALEWIDRWGDSDGDGFLEYARQRPTGLVNQGWKDSHDSVMHSDGRLAQAPIRLCEVQGYAFRARLGMATLAKLLGETSLATRLRLQAIQSRASFLDRFWDEQRKFIYLALDGDSTPCEVLSSNMGHCLWSSILLPHQAEAVTRHLMSRPMFSGHGIRTLATTERSYNPLSYHNGSIWPHDNSLIMEGMRYYGQVAALEKLALSMIGVLELSDDFRLPELFCGFEKQENEPPVPYEVACKPQAWAAGSLFLMMKSLLGLSMDPDQTHVVFRSPALTSKVNVLDIRGLRGRDWEMDVRLRRSSKAGTTVEVTRKSGKVRVLTVE